MGSRIRLLAPFLPYAAISVVHVIALFAASPVAAPTKLALMPALALAVIWAAALPVGAGAAPVGAGDAPGGLVTPPTAAAAPSAGASASASDAAPGRPASALRGARGAILLLVAAILCSWLGDGAATFFPMVDDELPMMLLCFGLAHVGYLLLMWRARGVARHRVPAWAAAYLLVYAVLIVVLIPRTGALTVPVMGYGLLLAGTAAMASRCGAVIAWGGAWFLVSDAILSFRIFLPEVMPDWTSGAVMLTYTLGQGLLAFGIVSALRRREARAAG